AELTKQYRTASILCHPDKFINESQEIQQLAEELFKELNEANSQNDLNRIEEILQNLQSGVLSVDRSNKMTDKRRLKQTIAKLMKKLEQLERELYALKNSERSRMEEITQKKQTGELRVERSNKMTDKRRLKQTIAKLMKKLGQLERELYALKNSDTYMQLAQITEWDRYCSENKELLKKELEELRNG